ncbi:MAG: plasmid pRiA4b ORF-3 family protein, partial [Kineosporiaceae bacterium]
LMAAASNLISVEASSAAGGPALGSWPPPEAEALLAAWLDGVRAICAEMAQKPRPRTVILLVRLALDLLAEPVEITAHQHRADVLRAQIHRAVCDDDYLYDHVDIDRLHGLFARSGRDAAWPMHTLLSHLGAVSGTAADPRPTALGRWAASALRGDVPTPVEGLSACALLDRLAGHDDADEQWRVARPWLRQRPPAQSADELLAAAGEGGAARRLAAVNVVHGLGEQAAPAWHRVVDDPRVGPHARAALADGDQGPGPAPDDEEWLIIENAAAQWEVCGPDAAICEMLDLRGGGEPAELIASLDGHGHPQAAALAQALRAAVTCGTPLAIHQVLQLKVSLTGWRPPIWRRVLVPASDTLGDLHEVIMILFGWDGDHLHRFEAGERRYADPFHDLEESSDEFRARLFRVFGRRGATVGHVYDFGACWQHQIVLEQVLPRHDREGYPRCIDHAHDAPPEYYDPDDPQDGQSFDRDAVNARLARSR